MSNNHAESEGECDDCKRIRESNSKLILCPKHDPATPTDESESYSEPKRRDKPDDIRTIRWRRTPSEVKDYIHDLQSEISDCWENQQEYKNDVAELQEELQDVREERDAWKQSYESMLKRLDDKTEELLGLKRDLRRNKERIEEARERLDNLEDFAVCFEKVGEIKEILSPETDEGDGD